MYPNVLGLLDVVILHTPSVGFTRETFLRFLEWVLRGLVWCVEHDSTVRVSFDGGRCNGKQDQRHQPRQNWSAHLDLPRGASQGSVQGEVHGELEPLIHWAVARTAVYAEELQKWRWCWVATSAPASMVLVLLWAENKESEVNWNPGTRVIYRSLMAVCKLYDRCSTNSRRQKVARVRCENVR